MSLYIKERGRIMQERECMNYAGNLQEEMREIQKLIPDPKSSVEMGSTQTRDCGAFLTIYCC